MSLAVDEGNVFRVVYDTSYKGAYYEQYCIELHDIEGIFVVESYNVPRFIPIPSLESKHKSDIRPFIIGVQSHLNAFVSRRQETLRTQVILFLWTRHFYALEICDFMFFETDDFVSLKQVILCSWSECVYVIEFMFLK